MFKSIITSLYKRVNNLIDYEDETNESVNQFSVDDIKQSISELKTARTLVRKSYARLFMEYFEDSLAQIESLSKSIIKMEYMLKKNMENH